MKNPWAVVVSCKVVNCNLAVICSVVFCRNSWWRTTIVVNIALPCGAIHVFGLLCRLLEEAIRSVSALSQRGAFCGRHIDIWRERISRTSGKIVSDSSVYALNGYSKTNNALLGRFSWTISFQVDATWSAGRRGWWQPLVQWRCRSTYAFSMFSYVTGRAAACRRISTLSRYHRYLYCIKKE